MINTKLKLNPTVLVVGLLFALFLSFEFYENTQLINKNKQLLISNIKSTVQQDIQQAITALPKNTASIRQNWLHTPRSAYWFNNATQQFPFVYNPKTALNTEDTARQIQNIKKTIFTLSKIDSDEQQQRKHILINIKAAITANNQTRLREELTQFLSHKRHTQLGPKFEIASWMALLSIHDKNQWSASIIERSLLTGWEGNGNKVASLLDIYFLNIHTFNLNEIPFIFNYANDIANKNGIKLDAAIALNKLINTPLLTDLTMQEGINIKNGNKIGFKQKNTHIILNTSIRDIAQKAIIFFRENGLLNLHDEISFKQQSKNTWQTLNTLHITIKSKSFYRQWLYQALFFASKIVLLFLFVFIAHYLIRAREKEIIQKENTLKNQNDFFNLVSHELKTPLSSIRIMAETLQKRIDKGLSTKDYSKRIIIESDELLAMIENILSIKMLTNNSKISYKKIDLCHTINQICESYPHPLDKKLYFDITLDLPIYLNAHPLLVELVFKNIISNAIKYTNQDIVILHIKPDTNRNNIVIKDNGIGIKKEDWDTIFTYFYRSKENSTLQKGMGLGLSLSRQIMRLFNSDISIIQSDNNGTTWKIWINNKT